MQLEHALAGHARSPGTSAQSFMDWLLTYADEVGDARNPSGLLASRSDSEAQGGTTSKYASLPTGERALSFVFPGSSAPQATTLLRSSDQAPILHEEAPRLLNERVDKVGTTNASTTPAAPKSNSWQRRKRELKQLRDEVAYLEGELKARRAYASGSFPAVHNSEEHRRRLQKRRQYLSIAWKLAAEREEQLKRASMVENARLKQLVERHTELSRALQPALFQQQITAVSLPQQARLQSNVERSGLFIALEQKLTARLPLVEEIVKHTCALAKRPVDMLEINVNDGETAQPAGNILRTKTFPFRVKSVMEIIRQSAEGGFQGIVSSSSMVIRELSEDVIGLDGMVEIPRDDASVHFHGQAVIKRWVTNDCELLQFGCVTNWLSGSKTKSMTEEFSWVVARNSSHQVALGGNSHMQSSMDSTLVSPCEQRRSSLRARRDLIANTVLPSLNVLMGRMEQTIENSLLDNARAASKT